jgi:Acetyltransferases
MRKLQWDSDFWGIEIFQIDDATDFDIDRLLNNPPFIQALPNVSDLNFIHFLESNGFLFKESKVTLYKNQINKLTDRINSFQQLSSKEIESYQQKFYVLFGKNSRYNIFPKNKVNKFYYTWVLNSIDGKMDDKCIGYYVDQHLAGFVTYRTRNKEISIGLLAVMPEFQGKGVSQLLLGYIDRVAIENDVSSVNISTQGTNISALNAYIKNGFKIKRIDHWYYYTKGVSK